MRAHVAVPVDVAWRAYTSPEDISLRHFANDRWVCPSAEANLRVEGTFEPDRDGTVMQTVFGPEGEDPIERRRDGWLAIRDNFAANAGGVPK